MSDESNIELEDITEVVFVADADVSSEEPPMDEWPSLIIAFPEQNPKRNEFQLGLYHPGSGEVCAKYIQLSDSDVFRHPYYNYPAIKDPGILTALIDPEDKIIYPDDGQELYENVCKEMEEAPVKSFVRGLLNEIIDLRYYCVSSKGIRAMSLALRFNRNVKVFNLTGSFLDDDACYHLGDMISNNCTLVELNLSGCKIGPAGAKRIFNGLTSNKTIRVLNLDKNDLTDQGMIYLASAIFCGIDIHEIFLSYNNITGNGVSALAEVFETFNKFTKIDLSWNNLYSPGGVYIFLSRLGENNVLTELNLSWNSMAGARIGTALKNVLSAPELRHLNLSNNKLNKEGISNLLPGLTKAKKLVTLDLSYNPMTTEDAKNVLNKVKDPKIKLRKLLMDNVFVDNEFLEILNSIKEMKTKQNLVVSFGGIVGAFKAVGPDVRELLLNRAEFLTKKSKKNAVDIALVAMQLLKDKNELMEPKEFTSAIQRSGAPLDNDLLEEIATVFAGPRLPKSKTVNIKLLVDYIKRKWPDKKLPTTPPSETEPASTVKENVKGEKSVKIKEK
ncbi:unnamed protein product [Diatraea saccharalis]|uniref:Uncharacterized protein n=1 Tax=Diatraea saccharalis TaxID=40085 RepID=A0A9N9QV99_9NEOP|nr:unnamed protein product [Diatraea saccharalis]